MKEKINLGTSKIEILDSIISYIYNCSCNDEILNPLYPLFTVETNLFIGIYKLTSFELAGEIGGLLSGRLVSTPGGLSRSGLLTTYPTGAVVTVDSSLSSRKANCSISVGTDCSFS